MIEQSFSKNITDWYIASKRELPWRNTTDPYRIWISEIILQQTRVAQGYDYYVRFVKRFPDVKSLSEASEDEVLKYWQGLGYYSRARNLHAAAHQIMDLHNGIFPATYKDVLSLKGVGEYTAAAICSFAFGLPHATVDGNVYRVLSRLYDVDLPIDSGGGKKFFAEMAQQLLSENDPATHNQAMMEFGAMLCIPKNPLCEECPFRDNCLAYANGTIQSRPVKQQKTEVKNRYFNYFCIRFGEKILLNKRTENDIWKNLYEFPLIETNETMEFEGLSQTEAFREMFDGITDVSFSLNKRDIVHVLSHRRIISTFYEVKVSALNSFLGRYLCIPDQNFEKYAVSRLVHLLIAE